jgi:hypothetical protein
VKAKGRAFCWRLMLQPGASPRSANWPRPRRTNSSYVSRVLRLTLLAPDIVKGILEGRQPEGVTLPGLREKLPAVWDNQRSGWTPY